MEDETASHGPEKIVQQREIVLADEKGDIEEKVQEIEDRTNQQNRSENQQENIAKNFDKIEPRSIDIRKQMDAKDLKRLPLKKLLEIEKELAREHRRLLEILKRRNEVMQNIITLKGPVKRLKVVLKEDRRVTTKNRVKRRPDAWAEIRKKDPTRQRSSGNRWSWWTSGVRRHVKLN